ncbi:MAG: gluconokinase [Jannaschia helgolandensis]
MRIVVMGVTSTGKSLMGRMLADALGGTFIDGDDLHPESNVAKMARGEPLNDRDRAPWLDLVGQRLAQGQGTVVVASSALKRIYRDRIRKHAGSVIFVHLTGPREVIAERMKAREGHFMPVSLLDSQLATLEGFAPGEIAVEVDITRPPARVLGDIMNRLRALA